VVAALLAFPCAARCYAEQRVRITGGADESGQNYAWTVENLYTSPVVGLEFPHFRADTFFAPAGWSKEGTTNLVHGGERPRPGVCRASVSSPEQGLAPGQSATFGLRLARAGALRRPGTVTVRFADHTVVAVGGVELPTAEPFSERMGMALGLGALLAILVIAEVHRRRRRAASVQKPSEA